MMKNIDEAIKIPVIRSTRTGSKIHFPDCSYAPEIGMKYSRGSYTFGRGYETTMTYKSFKKSLSYFARTRLCRYCWYSKDEKIREATERLTDEQLTDYIFNGDPYSRERAIKIRKRRKANKE